MGWFIDGRLIETGSEPPGNLSASFETPGPGGTQVRTRFSFDTYGMASAVQDVEDMLPGLKAFLAQCVGQRLRLRLETVPAEVETASDPSVVVP